MDAKSLDFASNVLVHLLERYNLTGCWNYRFVDRSCYWSPGFFKLLGLNSQTTRPNFDVISGLFHPDDGVMIEKNHESALSMLLKDSVFRVIRSDGTMRVLSSRSEIRFRPDGRPASASGVVLDVTDKERLSALRLADQRRKRNLFRQAGALLFSVSLEGEFSFPREAFELTGMSTDEIADDPFLVIVPEEREHWRSLSLEARDAGLIHTSRPLIHIKKTERGRFETFAAPIRDASGALIDWCVLAQPAGSEEPVFTEDLQQGIEQAIDGRHIRAARALLCWSMTDLANASQLSLSTIRRAEEHMADASAATRHRVVRALTRFGVRFSILSTAPSGTISVMKRRLF